MSDAPLYTWTVTDHRRARKAMGEAPGREAAQSAVLAQLKAWNLVHLEGAGATIFRPSSGGWFARPKGPGAVRWEAWEVPV